MDIIERLEKWLEKDQVVARDWGENGFSIDGDIEDAIDEIKKLRRPTSQSSGRKKPDYDPGCTKDILKIKPAADLNWLGGIIDMVTLPRHMFNEIMSTMKHARIFITSREKMQPVGVNLYDTLLIALHTYTSQQSIEADAKIRMNCAFLDEACVDCEEDCPCAGGAA